MRKKGNKEKKPPRPGDPEKAKIGRVPPKPNDSYVKYYHSNLVMSGAIGEKEWADMVEAFQRPLPCTVWITPTDAEASRAIEFLSSFETEGSSVVVRPLRWIPDRMGWYIDLPRAVLRKDPAYKPLHQFLIAGTEMGCLNRQEEVSMLPVRLLGVEAGDLCLDMCASPGSKTAQLLSALASANVAAKGRGGPKVEERVRGGFLGRVDYSKEEGCVVANDVCPDRINMLVHQIKRLVTLFPLAVTTNHDARYMPSLRLAGGEKRCFDKVLCDVMCSGDGTLRKAGHTWRSWNIKPSHELFPMQLAVALRGARLLRVGGRMAYSTCTLSPVENEAVVAALLRRTQGALRVISQEVKGLRVHPGMREWQVMCPRSGRLFSTHQAAQEVGGSGPSSLLPDFFPPSRDARESEELSKCLRLLPHANDTGGFFVCILEKVTELPGGEDCGYDSDRDPDPEAEMRRVRQKQLEDDLSQAKSETDRAKAAARLQRAKNSGGLTGEIARYRPLASAMPRVAEELRSVYGLSADLPSELLLCRDHIEVSEGGEHTPLHGEGGANQVLYCSRTAATILLAASLPAPWRRWKVVSGGLRTFQRDRFEAEGKVSSFRVAQESLDILFPYISRRIVRVGAHGDVCALLKDHTRRLPIAQVQDGPTKEALEAFACGGCVALLRTHQNDFVAVSALRSQHALNVYVDDESLPLLRSRCGVPDPEPEPTSKGESNDEE